VLQRIGAHDLSESHVLVCVHPPFMHTYSSAHLPMCARSPSNFVVRSTDDVSVNSMLLDATNFSQGPPVVANICVAAAALFVVRRVSDNQLICFVFFGEGGKYQAKPPRAQLWPTHPTIPLCRLCGHCWQRAAHS
jgi:hypothetical protein